MLNQFIYGRPSICLFVCLFVWQIFVVSNMQLANYSTASYSTRRLPTYSTKAIRYNCVFLSEKQPETVWRGGCVLVGYRGFRHLDTLLNGSNDLMKL